MCLDERTGNYVFAGTKFGEVYVIDVEHREFSLKPNLHIRLNAIKKGITHINYAGTLHNFSNSPTLIIEEKSYLYCNCMDNSIVVIELQYNRL